MKGDTARQLEAILRLRRERSRLFEESLFSDPAWDILLELFSARLNNRRVVVADLEGIAPASTLIRWITILEEKDLIACDIASPLTERSWIEMTEQCSRRMSALLSGERHLVQLD